MPTFFSRVRQAIRVLRQPAEQKRGYDAVKSGRLYSDWFAQATSGDTEIRNSIRKLLDRSRDLERNNDYMRAFLHAMDRNVLGSIKYDLRMDAGEYVYPKGQPPRWEKDGKANTAIEMAWIEWGKRGTCTVCGRYSWRDVKRLAVRAVARDGNIIVRKVVHPSVNRFGFALQLWEVDHLDIDKFQQLKGGGQIRFGIETDAYGKPVAYWLKGAHPGDLFSGSISRESLVSLRIAASEIYHLYVSERPEQTIGVPWVVSAITRLRQLGAFEEAATIAARLGASKAGFFKNTSNAGGEFTGGNPDADGKPVMDAQPGTFEALPQGWDLASWQPEYPNITTGDFRKAMLRGVASAFGMSYTTLGNDLESVNFSSARVGLFEEREGWKSLQLWFTEGLWEPIFGDWLMAVMMNGAVPLPVGKFEKFNRPMFKSRRWPFIDPSKEINAAREAIALRVTSRQQVIEEMGGDREDVFLDNLADEQYAEEIGLSLAPPDVLPEHFTSATANVTKKTEDDVDDPQKLDEDRQARALLEKQRDELERRLAALETKEPRITINNRMPPEEMPPQPEPPVVNVTVPPPIVNVTVPAPIVNFTAPEQPAPVVNVTVPAQPAPVVNVTVPPVDASIELQHNKDGEIIGAKIKK
jgi:lambda family phage portal protein